MRTDYKIGIAALVLVGVVITIWSLTSDPQPTPEPDDQPQDVARVEDDRAAAPRDDRNSSFYGTGRDDDVASGLGGAITGRPRDDAAGGPADVDDAAARADALAALRAAMLRSRARDEAAGGAPADGAGLPFGDRGLGALGHDRGAGVTRTDSTQPGGTTKYVVKKGDAGFWTVSERAYGDGKHWALIAKANPEADSNALREGQILKIPPLPVADSAVGGGTAVAGGPAAGQLVSRADGTRYYYVQEGDAGFWTVSQKAYGHGKHWAVIAKANPGVDSGSLKKGQKLLVPPLPAAGSTGGGGGRPSATTRTLGPGEKWYTVAEGDAGFWDVAKKSYGAGKHWEVIAKANPNVNPGRLRAGQKLIVPPLSASSGRSIRTSRPRDTSTSSRYADDEPIFE